MPPPPLPGLVCLLTPATSFTGSINHHHVLLHHRRFKPRYPAPTPGQLRLRSLFVIHYTWIVVRIELLSTILWDIQRERREVEPWWWCWDGEETEVMWWWGWWALVLFRGGGDWGRYRFEGEEGICLRSETKKQKTKNIDGGWKGDLWLLVIWSKIING